MRTQICDTFGIEFPIFAFSHCRDVVAAVSRSGGLGVLGALAQSFWIRSFRAGEASVVAPFDYLRLPMAATIGFIGFAELPTLWTFIGAGVIVASTLYIAHREAQMKRKPPVEAEPAVSGK